MCSKDEGSSLTSHVKKTVEGKRSLWEKLLTFFPGYRGYKEKEFLRETDKLVRDIVHRNIKEASEALREAYRNAINTTGLSQEAKSLEKLSMRCDAIREKIRHATYGYSPLGYAVKVDEESLSRLIEFDANLVDNIEALKTRIGGVKESIESGKLTMVDVKKIEVTIDSFEGTFNRRREALLLGEK